MVVALNEILEQQLQSIHALRDAVKERDALLEKLVASELATADFKAFARQGMSSLPAVPAATDPALDLASAMMRVNSEDAMDLEAAAELTVKLEKAESPEKKAKLVSVLFGMFRKHSRRRRGSKSRGSAPVGEHNIQTISFDRQVELLNFFSNPEEHEIGVATEQSQLWKNAKELLQLFPVTLHTILSATTGFFEGTGGEDSYEKTLRKQKAFFLLFTFYKLWDASDTKYIASLDVLIRRYRHVLSPASWPTQRPRSKASFAPSPDRRPTVTAVSPQVAREDLFQDWFDLGFQTLAQEITLNTPDERRVLRQTLVHDSHLMAYYIQNKGRRVVASRLTDPKVRLAEPDHAYLLSVYSDSIVLKELLLGKTKKRPSRRSPSQPLPAQSKDVGPAKVAQQRDRPLAGLCVETKTAEPPLGQANQEGQTGATATRPRASSKETKRAAILKKLHGLFEVT